MVREKSLKRSKRVTYMGINLISANSFDFENKTIKRGKAGDKLTNSLFALDQVRNKMRKTRNESEWGFLSYFVKRQTFCPVTFLIKKIVSFCVWNLSLISGWLQEVVVTFCSQMLLYIFCVNVTFCGVTTITGRKREPKFVYTYLACLMIFFRIKTSFMYFAETSKLK